MLFATLFICLFIQSLNNCNWYSLSGTCIYSPAWNLLSLFIHAIPLQPEWSLFPLSLNLAGLWLALTYRMWQKWHPADLRVGPSEIWRPQLLVSWGPQEVKKSPVKKKVQPPFFSLLEKEATEALDMQVKPHELSSPELRIPSQHR